jgi:hypothetical protein
MDDDLKFSTIERGTRERTLVQHHVISKFSIKTKREAFLNMRQFGAPLSEHCYMPKIGCTCGDFALFQILK